MTVYVCQEKDAECGYRPDGWCAGCPNRTPTRRLTPQEVEWVHDAVRRSSQFVAPGKMVAPANASPDYADEPWQDALLERAAAAGFVRDTSGDWQLPGGLDTTELLALLSGLPLPEWYNRDVAWLARTDNVSDKEALSSVLTGRSITEIKAELADLRERIAAGVPIRCQCGNTGSIKTARGEDWPCPDCNSGDDAEGAPR